MGEPVQPDCAAPPAFAEVYRVNFRFVWRVLARLGVPDRDLADSTQDVFLVVHRKLAEFDSQSRITTWLYAICFRVASQRRRAAPTRLELLDQEPPVEPCDDASEARAAKLAHHRRLLAGALDAMPLEQRAVFAFYELDGMSGDEIAEQVGVSVATVHSRLRLARLAFQRFVERTEARASFQESRCGGAS